MTFLLYCLPVYYRSQVYSRSVGYQSFGWASGRCIASCSPELCSRRRRRRNAGRARAATGWTWRTTSRTTGRTRRPNKNRWCRRCRSWWCRCWRWCHQPTRRTRTSNRSSCRRCCPCRRSGCTCTENSAGSTWPAVCAGPQVRRRRRRRTGTSGRRGRATRAPVYSTGARRWRPPWWATATAPRSREDCRTTETAASCTRPRCSDTWTPAASFCPRSTSGPNAADCHTRNCRSCCPSHGARGSRRPRKLDLFCETSGRYRYNPVHNITIN